MISTGKATIKNNRLREAYYSAINNATIGAIKWYYKENNITGIDVNSDYKKFINSYSILEQTIEDNKTVIVKLKLNLDDTGLNDAQILLSQYTDSAIYLYRGIDNSILPENQIKNTITSTLLSQQFSLSEEANFMGKVTDINNKEEIKKIFKDLKSSFLVIFDFNVIEDKTTFQKPENNCEITTTVSILNKQKDDTVIQIVTGDSNGNIALCYNNAIKQAANDTVTYIRENIIKLPASVAKLHKYKINLINANNLVLTKNIMDTLSQRGFIKSYKTLTYSVKNVSFEIESFFTPESLSEKIQKTKLPMQPTSVEFGSKELNLDFSTKNKD